MSLKCRTKPCIINTKALAFFEFKYTCPLFDRLMYKKFCFFFFKSKALTSEFSLVLHFKIQGVALAIS